MGLMLAWLMAADPTTDDGFEVSREWHQRAKTETKRAERKAARKWGLESGEFSELFTLENPECSGSEGEPNLHGDDDPSTELSSDSDTDSG